MPALTPFGAISCGSSGARGTQPRARHPEDGHPDRARPASAAILLPPLVGFAPAVGAVSARPGVGGEAESAARCGREPADELECEARRRCPRRDPCSHGSHGAGHLLASRTAQQVEYSLAVGTWRKWPGITTARRRIGPLPASYRRRRRGRRDRGRRAARALLRGLPRRGVLRPLDQLLGRDEPPFSCLAPASGRCGRGPCRPPARARRPRRRARSRPRCGRRGPGRRSRRGAGRRCPSSARRRRRSRSS